MNHYKTVMLVQISECQTPLHKCKDQWCSRDRNLRDRDMVKISRRDRDFIKNSETRDLKFETWDIKICAFCRNFSKKCRHHFWP